MRLFVYLSSLVVLLLGCKTNENQSFDLTVVLSFPVEDEAELSANLMQLTMPYVIQDIEEQKSFTPATVVRTLDDTHQYAVFPGVEQTFAGDPNNLKFIQQQVQDYIQDNRLPEWVFSDEAYPVSDPEKLVGLSNHLLSSTKAEVLIYHPSSGLSELPFPSFGDFDSLRTFLVDQLSTTNKRKFLLMYQPRNPDELSEETTDYFTIRTKNRQTENTNEILDEIDLVLQEKLKANPINHMLWFERSVNRARRRDYRTAVEYFRNAARYAIEQGASEELVAEYEVIEHTYFSATGKNSPRHIEGILYSLEERDTDLVEVVPYVSIRSAKRGYRMLSIWINQEAYTHSDLHYRVAAYAKQGGKLDVALFLPVDEEDITIRKTLQIGESISGIYGPNGEWTVKLVNDSEVDKNYARFLHKIQRNTI